jgi:hypothetical protein
MTPEELAIPVTQAEMGNLCSGTQGHELHIVARRMAYQIDILRAENARLVAEKAKRKTLAEDIAAQNDVIVLKAEVEQLKAKVCTYPIGSGICTCPHFRGTP